MAFRRMSDFDVSKVPLKPLNQGDLTKLLNLRPKEAFLIFFQLTVNPPF